MRRERLINIIRSLGYSFRRDAWRIQDWKRSTDGHTIQVPKRDILSEEYVRSVLRQAGCDADQITEFLRDGKS